MSDLAIVTEHCSFFEEREIDSYSIIVPFFAQCCETKQNKTQSNNILRGLFRRQKDIQLLFSPSHWSIYGTIEGNRKLNGPSTLSY